jgi:cytochrome c
MACHGLVHKQVGPGFAQVAARYRDEAAQAARRNGSVGAWGRVINTAADPGQAEATEL